MTKTRENHYVPRRALRRWSHDGIKVNVYSLLVPHARVPLWAVRSIKKVAAQTDLYTEFNGEEEDDAFERQLTHDYEEPGQNAIDKLLKGDQVRPADWDRIINFFALQAMRTPKALIDFVNRTEKHILTSLEKTVREAEARLRSMGTPKIALSGDADERNYFKDSLRVRIEQSPDAGAVVKAELKSPRSLWTAMIRQVLERGAASVLRNHRWSIAEAYGEAEWPLTDNPVLCLNFNSATDYDFGGGWGKENSDLIMPISPTKLLFVEVGKKMDNRFTLTRDQTTFMQRALSENAYRTIVTRNPAAWAVQYRPRTVDPVAYREEQVGWGQWLTLQTQQEEEFFITAPPRPPIT